MSSLPPPPPPPPWAAPAPPAPSAWVPSEEGWDALRPTAPPEPERRPRWLGPLGGAIGVVFLAALGVAMARSVDSGPDHPDAWDPRVSDLAAFVEDERGHDFDHPVYVDFLTAAEYTAQTTGVEDGAIDELEESEQAEYEDYAGELRALGVASGELDLYEAFNAVVDSGTLAFYDPTDERIRVRGTDMTVGLEVTLVHELTHALQDQRFDLERLQDAAVDPGASTAFRALAEGDAVRVENAYIEEELTDDQQTAYDEEFAGELADSEAATRDVPPYIEAEFGVPYALGGPFVTMLYNQDRNDRIDEAFEDPPDTEEHLLDPTSFLSRDEAADVELDLPEGAEVIEESSFGATSWYLVLAERIDPKQAMEAAFGWDGDAFASYRHDDEVCVQAVYSGDTPADEDEMREALDTWVAAMPGGEAKVIEVDGNPGIDACDPGEEADLKLTGRSANSLYLPNLWAYLVADAAAVLDADGSRCYARAVIEGLTYEEITDPDGAAFAGDTFQERLADAFDDCSD